MMSWYFRLIVGEKSPRCPNCDFPVCDPSCPGLDDMEKHGHECMILGLRDISAINGLHDFYRWILTKFNSGDTIYFDFLLSFEHMKLPQARCSFSFEMFVVTKTASQEVCTVDGNGTTSWTKGQRYRCIWVSRLIKQRFKTIPIQAFRWNYVNTLNTQTNLSPLS